MKDCYLQKNELFDKYISNTVVRFDNDYESITSGIDDVIEDYVTVLKAAVKLCEVSLIPLFDDDLNVLSRYVKLSFEPYMRLIDSKLYQYIQKTKELNEIAPQILMGALLSHLQYNCNNLEQALRFMDASVHGDWVTEIFICIAALSIAVRYRNPTMFKNDDMRLPRCEGYETLVIDNEENDVLYRVMGSLDAGEKIVQDFADQAIRLGLTAYYVVCVSQ